MKKTLIATTLLTLMGVSSGAIAALTFNDGTLAGDVAITGTVEIPPASVVWEWEGGSDKVLDSTTAALDTAGKKLTMPAPNDIRILVGQWKDAVLNTTVNSVLTNNKPIITFTDKDGKSTPINFSISSTEPGKGIIILPVTDELGVNKIGDMTLKVKVAAAVYSKENNNSQTGDYGFKTTTVKGSNTNFDIFDTSIVSTNQGNSVANDLDWIKLLGANLDKNSFAISVRRQNPVITHNATSTPTPNIAMPMNQNNYWYAAAYGLGVAKNDNIVIDFSSAITSDLKWKSSINVNITYI